MSEGEIGRQIAQARAKIERLSVECGISEEELEELLSSFVKINTIQVPHGVGLVGLN